MRKKNTYEAPIAIHCIWNCADKNLVEPLIERLAALITRDVKRPFSHGINIPLFVYRSENASALPHELRHVCSRRNICFVFTSEETAGRGNWKNYYSKLQKRRDLCIVPIALNNKGLSAFAGVNAIRYEDGDDAYRLDICLIAMLHEIFRYGFAWSKRDKIGQDSSLKIFLSHSKGDSGRGVAVVERLRKVIKASNMRSFFDATAISPGRDFEREIRRHLESGKCGIIAVKTDGYSSRYWCQKEILLAKDIGLPVLVVDYLSDAEDRAFPAASNVPVTRINEISEQSVLLILTRLLTETIRCKYVKALMEEYKSLGWIPSKAQVLIRPPELYSAYKDTQRSMALLCYPDPPLFSDEFAKLERINARAFTPLQCSVGRFDDSSLRNKSIGLSISDIAPVTYDRQAHSSLLKAFACDIARHIISRGGSLIYGGDLRHDGFTEYIISEASALQNRTRDFSKKVVDYLAWPLYVENKEVLGLRSDYSAFLDIKEVVPAKDIKSRISKEKFIPPTTPENCYIWSRCLTEMRKASIGSSFARICAGGKLAGYNGKMPGVLEEIVITIEGGNKPLFLCGGFGGVVGEVCKAIEDQVLPECLTEQWQFQHNAGYSDLQALAKRYGNEARYENLSRLFCGKKTIDRLAMRAGLKDAEYILLMNSPFIDECIYLILKGLSRLIRR